LPAGPGFSAPAALPAGPELAFPVDPTPAIFPPGSASPLAWELDFLVDPTPVAFPPGSASALVSQTFTLLQ
jgi:hypothetical protein